MAKTAATSTLPAIRLAPYQPIVKEDVREVVEMQNHAVCYRPPVLLSVYTAPAKAFTDSPLGVQLYFDGPDNTYETRITTTVYIHAEMTGVRVVARSAHAVADSGDIRVTIGAATAVSLVFNNGTNGTLVSDVIDVSALSGAQTCTIELQKDAGSGATSYLLNVTLQMEELDPTALPDP